MNKAKHGFTLVEIMIVVAIIALLAVIAVPSFAKVRKDSWKKTCINNLRIMDDAKEQAAMERRWPPNKAIADGSPAETNCLEYIKGNKKPTCPAGGTVSWNGIGVTSACTTEGHVLPY